MSMVVCLIAACLAIVLAVLSAIDVKTRIVPSLGIAAFLMLWVWGVVEGVITAPIENLLAAVLFGGLLLCFTLLFEKCLGKEALGGGDIKLLACFALFLGFEGTLMCLATACIVACGWALVARKKNFPFVPALSFGFLLVCTLPVI